MEKIVIVGAGGFGREVKMLIDQINQIENKYEFLGYYDDGILQRTAVNYNEVLGSVADLADVDYKINVVVAIGSPDVKRKIVEKLINPHLSFPTLIHPSVIIGDEFVSIGKGCIICAGNVITCNITIKDFVILNLHCTVGHDTMIHSFASLLFLLLCVITCRFFNVTAINATNGIRDIFSCHKSYPAFCK